MIAVDHLGKSVTFKLEYCPALGSAENVDDDRQKT
jgi:hypothetical protein